MFDAHARDMGATTVTAQVQLTGVPRPTLYRLFDGHPPSGTTAAKIADALGVSLSVVFESVKE